MTFELDGKGMFLYDLFSPIYINPVSLVEIFHLQVSQIWSQNSKKLIVPDIARFELILSSMTMTFEYYGKNEFIDHLFYP